MSKSINEIVIHNSFESAHEKCVDQLCDEIFVNNPNTTYSNQIKNDYEKIQQCYEGTSKVLDGDSLICKFSKREISKWTSSFRAKRLITADEILINLVVSCVTVNKQETPLKDPPSIHEQIAILMRAFKLFKGYEPRPIQIISLLLLLNPESEKGRLAQINTGEGKTTIVAMLAVIKALAGHTVDVITSSSELAKPQAEELKAFYEMFGLSVSHNGSDSVDKTIRYKSDIVYGAANDFQGDILRDEYSKLGTRSGRRCDFAIVDEVDSMLIDGRKHIVMLSTDMPSMNYLEHFYAAIWLQVRIFTQAIKEINGKFYFIQSNPIKENGEVDETSDDEAFLIEGSKEDFIKKRLLDEMRKDIEAGEDSKLKVPAHLKDMVLKRQLEQWISCAIFAKYNSKHNQNYILDNKGKVIPVDADNTGVLQQNMNWSNGLHQFLQIKHGVSTIFQQDL
jgi:preprotein translocase subunit SecA